VRLRHPGSLLAPLSSLLSGVGVERVPVPAQPVVLTARGCVHVPVTPRYSVPAQPVVLTARGCVHVPVTPVVLTARGCVHVPVTPVPVTPVTPRYSRYSPLLRATREEPIAGFGQRRFASLLKQVYHWAMDYSRIITIEPGKRSGRPCIRGLRITVTDVLEYLAAGMTEEQIISDFPELTKEDIHACLAFAAEREKRLSVAVA